MICRHAEAGASGLHGVLTRHDFFAEAFDRFQNILLGVIHARRMRERVFSVLFYQSKLVTASVVWCANSHPLSGRRYYNLRHR